MYTYIYDCWKDNYLYKMCISKLITIKGRHVYSGYKEFT
jgi:hypothetical protein